MKMRPLLLASLAALALTQAPSVDAQIAPSELVAPKLEISGGNLNFTVQPSVIGRTYQLQGSNTMVADTWQNLGDVVIGTGSNLVISIPYVPSVAQHFYRLLIVVAPAAPDGYSLIPAGAFLMGDQSDPLVGFSNELPVHSVYVSGFYMAKHEVTKALWDEVGTWAATNGYDITVAGASAKGANHPVYYVNWYECVKWCNARSEKEGLTPCYTLTGIYRSGLGDPQCNWAATGYRLPTEAEWERAARGGLVGLNFPWGNTISHTEANFRNIGGESYQTGATGYHPAYATGSTPFTSPVGSFAANGYGIYDMAGNVSEWCWNSSSAYPSEPQTDPRDPSSGNRVVRGGSWYQHAYPCRVARRDTDSQGNGISMVMGFRLVRSVVP
jgi:sulfatase modifying factor 1